MSLKLTHSISNQIGFCRAKNINTNDFNCKLNEIETETVIEKERKTQITMDLFVFSFQLELFFDLFIPIGQITLH